MKFQITIVSLLLLLLTGCEDNERSPSKRDVPQGASTDASIDGTGGGSGTGSGDGAGSGDGTGGNPAEPGRVLRSFTVVVPDAEDKVVSAHLVLREGNQYWLDLILRDDPSHEWASSYSLAGESTLILNGIGQAQLTQSTSGGQCAQISLDPDISPSVSSLVVCE